MLAQHATRLQLHDRTDPLSQMLPEEVVVVDPAEEADPLAVVPVGGDQVMLLSDGSEPLLGEIPDREERLMELRVGDLGKEVGLILHRVDRCGEVVSSVDRLLAGVVSRGDMVVGGAGVAVEGAKLDPPIAHHIRIGRQPPPLRLQQVADYMVPVLPVEIDHLEWEIVLPR